VPFRLDFAAGPRRRRDLRQCGGLLLLLTVHEPDHGFERDLHFKAGRACLLTTRLYLLVFCDRGGNRVGKLASEPIHDLVHLYFPPTPPGRVTAAPPDRLATPWRGNRDRVPDVMYFGLNCRQLEFNVQYLFCQALTAMRRG